MSMNIRLATRDDLPAILEISNWAAINTSANFAIEPETLASWTQSFEQTHRMYPWLVARDAGNRVIGFAKASPHRGRCAYAWTAEVSVYIDPDHHRRGVGRALYNQLLPILKAQGYVTLIAGITVPHPASQRLHESFGFKRCATFERVGWKFNSWYDVGYWELIVQTDKGPPQAIRPVADVVASAVAISR
jgi:phosphinothricin acetyltransferase